MTFRVTGVARRPCRKYCARTASANGQLVTSDPAAELLKGVLTGFDEQRVASGRFSTGTTASFQPSPLAASTADSTPRTGRTRPSRANSPSTTTVSSCRHGVFRWADNTPAASAISKVQVRLFSCASRSAQRTALLPKQTDEANSSFELLSNLPKPYQKGFPIMPWDQQPITSGTLPVPPGNQPVPTDTRRGERRFG
jgi:hypothetical protein